MGSEVAGREDELQRIHQFVDASTAGCRVLLLEGEPGIGKTMLWRAGVDRARERGLLVLAARPAEREQHLALAGLGDLLEEVLESVVPLLVAPRRQALATALLRDSTGAAPLDHRALAVGVRDVLHMLTERGQVMLAVDDLQWLDSVTTAALAFALRRTASRPLILLLARRQPEGAETPFEDALVDVSNDRIALGGLSPGALHQMARDRLGRSLPRQTLLRIHELSEGNPLFALELVRALSVDGDEGELLTVPVTLEKLVRARLTGLPEATFEALAIMSAVGSSRMSLLERAGVSEGALEPALSAQVIEKKGGEVRFTHPMLSSVLYRDLGHRQQSVHALIARSLDDPMERARHVALAAQAPDAGVADMLDLATQQAASLGAAAAMAELAEQSVRLTPTADREVRRRRTLVAARAHQVAGEWTRARAILARLLEEPDAGPERAEVLLLAAELEDVDRSAVLLEEAVREAEPQSKLCAVIESRLAWSLRFSTGLSHAHAAVGLAGHIGDPTLLVRVRAVQAVMSWFHGDGPAPGDLLSLAGHLPGALGGDRLVQEGTQAVVNTCAPASLRPLARGFLEREHERWRELDEAGSARALWGLAWLEFFSGDWAVAYGNAVRSLDISTQYGLEVPQDHLPVAVIAVHRGDLQVARQHSRRALALAEKQFGGHPPQHLAVLGLADLWEGDGDTALSWLGRAEQRATTMGWREPSLRWWTGDLVELLAGLGRVEEAQRLLSVWDADAARVARPWVLGHVARGQGLVASATGDVEGALSWLERAVDLHDGVGDPYGRARALLALGIARRRDRQKKHARGAIEAAVSGFEVIGATGWAERSRAELGRLSGRRREQGLTAAERRVADLVAEGMTNREVAASLFLGERTVASHLTHIYAKLGVRSRTELARVPQAGVVGEGPVSSANPPTF